MNFLLIVVFSIIALGFWFIDSCGLVRLAMNKLGFLNYRYENKPTPHGHFTYQYSANMDDSKFSHQAWEAIEDLRQDIEDFGFSPDQYCMIAENYFVEIGKYVCRITAIPIQSFKFYTDMVCDRYFVKSEFLYFKRNK